MRHFMAKDACEFILAIDERQKSAGDVKAAAWNGKGIWFLLIRDLKGELPALVARSRGESIPHLAKILFHWRRGVQANILFDLFGDFGALLDVALSGWAEELGMRWHCDGPDEKEAENKKKDGKKRAWKLTTTADDRRMKS
jgi:hypothetical protein